MDTKTLIREAHARFDHNSAKKILKEKYQAKLIIANQNGLWKASPELIGYLTASTQDNIILSDTYENPVTVNRLELLNALNTTYNEVMLGWHTEFQELRHKR